MSIYQFCIQRHQNIVHDRLNKAAERIASYWYTCWVNAGSPINTLILLL